MPTIYTLMLRIANTLLDRSKTELPKHKIAVYFDQGVSLSSAISFVMNCRRVIKNSDYSLCLVNGETLQSKMWEQETALLVFPGGRARPYYKSLGARLEPEAALAGERRKLMDIGVGNRRIKHFVTEGGSYLGLCAGAYYAAQETVFEKGKPLEVLDEGALGFFRGVAEGPAYDKSLFSYHSKKGARLASISWLVHQDNPGRKTGYVYYNGGCFFKTPGNYKGVKVLSRYEDIEKKPAAIVLCQVGKGKAVLSGIHPEISYPFSPLHFFLKTKLLYLFFHNNEFQQKLLCEILNLLLNKIGNQEDFKSSFDRPGSKRLS